MYLVNIVGFGIQAICQFFVGFILSIAISHNRYIYSFLYLCYPTKWMPTYNNLLFRGSSLDYGSIAI